MNIGISITYTPNICSKHYRTRSMLSPSTNGKFYANKMS